MVFRLMKNLLKIFTVMGVWMMVTDFVPALSPSNWHNLTQSNIHEVEAGLALYVLLQPLMVGWWGNQIANLPKGYARNAKGVREYRRVALQESNTRANVTTGLSLPALAFVSIVIGFLHICGLRLTQED